MQIDSLLRKAKEKATELTDKFVNSEFGQEIDAANLVDKTKKVTAKVKEAAGVAKGYAYKGAGILERQYNQKQGIGGGIRTTINRGRILAKGLKFAAKPAINKSTEYYQKIHDYNQSFIETFTTEGKYDKSKLNDALLHIAAITEVYGKKAADKLMGLGKKRATAFYKDYRNWAPTLDELKGKYAGIGTRCEGFIFKPDLEKCLKFHNEAFQKLPREDLKLNLTLFILQDIKTNVITNKEKLLKFYMPDGNPKENKDKVDMVINYLQDEEIQNVRTKNFEDKKDRKE